MTKPRDPDALHTTTHRLCSRADVTVALLHYLSRADRPIDDPLVAIVVRDRGDHSYATVQVRDEVHDTEATIDADLDDLRTLEDAIREARKTLERVLADAPAAKAVA